MSARDFLFAADALRIEDGLSFHVETPSGSRPAISEDTKKQNAESMQALMGMMSGVQKGKR